MFSPLISQLFWPGPVSVQLEFVLISLFILISVFILISGCGMTVCFIRYIGGRAVDQFINFIKIYFQFCHSKASKAIRKQSYHRHGRIWFGAPRLQRLWHPFLSWGNESQPTRTSNSSFSSSPKLRTFVGDNSKVFIILLIKQNNKHGHVRSGFPGFKKFFSPQDFYLQPQFWTKK